MGNGECPAVPGKPTLTVSNPNPVEGEVVTFTCTPSTDPNDRWIWNLYKNGKQVHSDYGERVNRKWTYSHQVTYSSADEGSYTCRMYFTCFPESPDSEGIEVKRGEVIQRIIVEVGNQKNSESKDSECAIAFAGGVSSATFTAPGGQVFHNGHNEAFSISGLASGVVSSGIKLKCMSATHDALNVDKLFVFTDWAGYVADVRTVFDDLISCNTAGTHNRAQCLPPFDKCCKDEVVLSMVSFP